MAIPDAHTQAYINVFRGQSGGGGIAVFQGGSRYQSGQGIGDFFRGLLRHILPVALGVGKAALSAFSGAHEEGASIKDSFKAAIRPSLQAAATGTVEQIQKAQEGRGRRRKRVYKPKSHKRRKTKTRGIYYNF